MPDIQTCQACGATIYPEHIDQGRAGRWGGQLLCPVCYGEKRSAAPAAPSQAEPIRLEPVDLPGGADEPISLVEAPGGPGEGASRIQNFSGQAAAAPRKRTFARTPAVTGHGACRVRTFHSKIQAESIEFLDDAINEWLDQNPDIEVKFVTTTIGVMAGKHPEPNLILNLWY